ncbi:DUF4974 domain-containing protein [Sphingobacterium sp. SGG-5]|uniref:FecR family protein n=1 Tax=Sphingobacterium sp. SGG-5 TaxID=2710881 RepID=UPI0013EB092F|nr:FecR family protein [Sphingobacterium sp. SGG-5]NGM62463.1 DUF4974 domain-containing protein [Sphingobacterium sp. SGG-5]
MDNKRMHRVFYIVSLIQKHLDGTLTANEQKLLISWRDEHPANRQLFEELLQAKNIQEFEASYLSINTSRALVDFKRRYTLEQKSPASIRKILIKISYAAAVLLVVTGATWFLMDRQPRPTVTTVALEHQDIQPGGNRATLTFADGRTIDLSEEQTGIIVNGESISYQEDDIEIENLDAKEAKQLRLATPKGGMYSVTLSDGTQVWLNAESTLEYPSHFGTGVRVVRLDGEAYFDVAKVEGAKRTGGHLLQPFIVISRGQRVEVLGTKFNVSVYGDQPELKTTLVEGSVRLVQGENEKGPSVILKPGQQGIVSEGALAIGVKTVDTESLIAWKDGYFYFNNTPTVELMKEVARWYDVEVVYKGKMPNDTFSGKVKRNTTLMGLMEILQLSTINVKLEDNKLIIN